MNRTSNRNGFFGAVLLLVAGAVAAQPMGGPMGGERMGGDRMGGAHMGGPMGAPMGRWWERPKVVEQLGLTPEQTKKLEAITLDQARTMVDLKGAVEKAEIDLRAASDADPFNAKRVRDAFGVLIAGAHEAGDAAFRDPAPDARGAHGRPVAKAARRGSRAEDGKGQGRSARRR